MESPATPLTLIERLLAHVGLLSRPQLAAMLGIKPGTLAAWEYRKVGLPIIKVGGLVRYDPVAVAAWLTAQQDEPLTPKPEPVPAKPLPTWLQNTHSKSSLTSGC